MTEPILYTFRRCPYAMRARMALASAGIDFEVREVILKDKPNDMLALSAKGTVPVLHLLDQGGVVIDESLDVMHWALAQHDPENLLVVSDSKREEVAAIVQSCDGEFKKWLDLYKYNDRQADYTLQQARGAAEVFLKELEQLRLENAAEGDYLLGKLSFVDLAVFPFIRQFAFVDKPWFDQAPYPLVQKWLAMLLNSERFNQVMHKYPQWQTGQERIVFCCG